MDKVLVITGPTAVGKTEISLEIAKHFNGEIINADASQFRRKLNIGTAKINLAKVDVNHHLIDIIDIEDSFSIKDYQMLAREKIEYLLKNHQLPILVGGSGLYINAAIGDYDLNISGRNLEFEKQYENYTNKELHQELQKYDYLAAGNIHPNNRRRVLRAIEAAKLGNKISENKTGHTLKYDVLIICLMCEREILYDRINKRVDIMFQEGWLDEVKALKVQGVNLEGIKDIGYQEINQYLEGQLAFDETKDTIKQKTRKYAKRQITWFKHKMSCQFINVDFNNLHNTYDEIINLVSKFIND